MQGNCPNCKQKDAFFTGEMPYLNCLLTKEGEESLPVLINLKVYVCSNCKIATVDAGVEI